MNVYDAAHGLADAIKASEEYKQFRAAKERVDQNPELSAMLRDFENRQFQEQAKQMSGQDTDQAAMAKIQELSQILMRDPEAALYLQAAMRFSLMISDVYKIVGEAVDVGNMPKV